MHWLDNDYTTSYCKECILKALHMGMEAILGFFWVGQCIHDDDAITTTLLAYRAFHVLIPTCLWIGF